MTKEEKIREQRMKNLVSMDKRSPEEVKAICSKAGKDSQKKRQETKTMKQALEWALALPAVKGCPTVDTLRKKYPGLTNRDAMAISVIAEGVLRGNVKAFTAVVDTMGESNPKKLDVSASNFKIEIEEVE